MKIIIYILYKIICFCNIYEKYVNAEKSESYTQRYTFLHYLIYLRQTHKYYTLYSTYNPKLILLTITITLKIII